MAKDLYIDFENFKKGLYALEDTTSAPFGSARIMNNVQVTDRGGISPREGTLLLGTKNNSTYTTKGFFNFKKSNGSNEILLKAYDDELEAYSNNHSSADWFRIKSGFTQDKEFGFVTSLVNTDNEDYAVFCNRYDEYQRWTGAVTLLNGALSGGETSVTVDSTLTSDIFDSRTATGSSATTLSISTTPWAADQWINFYVHITSGTHNGKIRKITDNTTSQITFDTLGSDPGNCTFEIRLAAFPATGTIIYNGTIIAYTAIPTATTFTVSSAHAGSDNAAVTLAPNVYPGAPRGNRIDNYLNRVIVGNVRSSLSRDSGGALQGSATAGSYFVSKVNNHTNFDFSATRVAGEGDIISTPYGGGDITDVKHQEDAAYIFKKRYIESVKYSQDANDLASREPLKAGTGSIGKTIKGSDDIYFITDDHKFVSLGRVRQKDLKPQTENIGYSIKRLLDQYDFSQVNGIEYKDKIYICCKSDENQTNNNKVLIYNKANNSFEGTWDLYTYGFQEMNGDLYFAESNGVNVHKMFTGNSDVEGTDTFPISSEYATHFMNLTKSNANLQALNSLYFEGYINEGSSITFRAFKEFSDDPFLSFTFSGTETEFLYSTISNAFLGGSPIGLRPIGAMSGNPDADGRRHFQFRVYFPFQYGEYFSVGWVTSGTDIDVEVTRFGLGLKESISTDMGHVRNI